MVADRRTSAAGALECIGCLHCYAVCPQGAISADFGMGRREQVHAVVVLGYPAVRFQRPVPRRPVPVTGLG